MADTRYAKTAYGQYLLALVEAGRVG
jgi:hypothetical protein